LRYRVILLCARAAESAPGTSSEMPKRWRIAGIMKAVISFTQLVLESIDRIFVKINYVESETRS
jgi:hypothetical protein